MSEFDLKVETLQDGMEAADIPDAVLVVASSTARERQLQQRINALETILIDTLQAHAGRVSAIEATLRAHPYIYGATLEDLVRCALRTIIELASHMPENGGSGE